MKKEILIKILKDKVQPVSFSMIMAGIVLIALDGQDFWPWLLLTYPMLLIFHYIMAANKWGKYKDDENE